MNPSVQAAISVVIPTYQRPCALQRCLQALCAQTYPAELFEVIVVNDGGQPCPEGVLSGISTRIRVRLVNQTNTGPGGARNRGAAEARYPLLAFLDDDCIPEPGWLEALSGAHVSLAGKVIAGRTLNGFPANPYASTSQLINEYLVSKGLTSAGEVTFAPTSNLALEKTVFDACGGFDTVFKLAAGEDRDLCARLIAMGYTIVSWEKATVLHCHPLTMRTFMRQQYHYGRGAYQYRVRQCRTNGGRMVLEKLSFYIGLITHAVDYGWRHTMFSIPLLSVAAQVAVAAGFFQEWMLPSAKRSADQD